MCPNEPSFGVWPWRKVVGPGPGPGREKGTRCVVVTRLPKLLKEKAEFWWFTVRIASGVR